MSDMRDCGLLSRWREARRIREGRNEPGKEFSAQYREQTVYAARAIRGNEEARKNVL